MRRAVVAPSRLSRWARPALALLVAVSLLSAVAGGLSRAGLDGAVLRASLVGQAAVLHAALMISGFLGTAIGVERAVAVKLRWAFAAPAASGLASVMLLAGEPMGTWLAVSASVVFVAVNIALVRRQPAIHTGLLLAGALAWLVGNLLFATARTAAAALPWWFAFLVFTIAAERLEMTRLMRRHPAARPTLLFSLGLLLAGAVWSGVSTRWGGSLYGVALMALAAWLAVFDIARRTVWTQGLARYMALCLLSGYAWLGVAGLAWLGTAWGCPGRDMALHALGLGFIVGMVMGHAPVILPAVARVKLLFGPWFYAPVLLLQVSLWLRLVRGTDDPVWRGIGAALNAAAMALFALVLLGSALAWARRAGITDTGTPPA